MDRLIAKLARLSPWFILIIVFAGTWLIAPVVASALIGPDPVDPVNTARNADMTDIQKNQNRASVDSSDGSSQQGSVVPSTSAPETALSSPAAPTAAEIPAAPVIPTSLVGASAQYGGIAAGGGAGPSGDGGGGSSSSGGSGKQKSSGQASPAPAATPTARTPQHTQDKPHGGFWAPISSLFPRDEAAERGKAGRSADTSSGQPQPSPAGQEAARRGNPVVRVVSRDETAERASGGTPRRGRVPTRLIGSSAGRTTPAPGALHYARSVQSNVTPRPAPVPAPRVVPRPVAPQPQIYVQRRFFSFQPFGGGFRGGGGGRRR